MKKKIIITAILGFAAALSASTAFAQAQYAFDLGVYPKCNGCHNNAADYYGGNKGNVLPGAAWNHLAISTPASPTCTGKQVLDATTNTCITPVPVCTGGTVLNAAKDTCVAPPPPTCTNGQVLNPAQTACITPAPVVPTCTNGQVLNPAQTACITPTPVVPTCTNGQVLNPAKTACVTSTPVVPTCTNGQVLNPAKTACISAPVTKVNTAPVLNAVAPQWDAKVGELISIPLSVKDAEQDTFTMTGSVNGSKFSAVHPDAAGLPSIDFTWTPTATQVNKIFTVTFQAKETKTTQHLASNKVSVKIRVWAAGNKSAASITKLNVITSKWTAGKLNLAGNVVLNSLLTPAEKQTFIAQKLDLTVSSSSGALVGSTPLTLDTKGNWSATLPVTQSPCDIILQFDGQNAARTVVGCVKPVAVIATPVTVASNVTNPFKGGEHESDENDEHENNEHD
ncbi:MAG: hypothetical protein PHN45_01265 [Methylococcales bacterium]|nr:hypothetical protein [Methylococcales bacterium]MDD5753370.1 hypothetical protein [Methylococcales bacterium]